LVNRSRDAFASRGSRAAGAVRQRFQHLPRTARAEMF